MKAADKRAYLKSKGWRRCDRADGPNQSIELWVRPWTVGFQPLGISLQSAYTSQKKLDDTAQAYSEFGDKIKTKKV